MGTPRVSILMATWNRAGLIGAAIESLQRQSFTDWELVIADDGSTDETPKVVEELMRKGPRIIYSRSEVNQGISKNYNRGFGLMKGEYVAMIDDDDPWCDDRKLEKQIGFLEKNPEYVGCGGGVIVVSQPVIASEAKQSLEIATVPPQRDLAMTGQKELYRYFKPETDAEIRKVMLFSNPMANSTTLFRRIAGEKVGWYADGVRYAGDYDFWMKMGLVGKLYNFPEYFSYYTMSGENTSIAKIKPHLQAVLGYMKHYKGKYPRYYQALAFNYLQYAYAFLPVALRRRIHQLLARLKRVVFG